jgi:hypothetical protein
MKQRFFHRVVSIVALGTILLTTLWGGIAQAVNWSSAPLAATPPYPPSQLITGLTWDSTVVRVGDGVTGDNWPITWGDDDLLYVSYGDGDGFSHRSPKLSLGFATLAGEPPGLTPRDLSSNIDTPEGQGSNGIKASGMLMVDGRLYLFVRNYKPAGSNDYTNSRLAWSTDHGRTWTWANWLFADTFGAPDFIQFGKNYAGARDQYVYIVSQANDSAYGWSPSVVLARVPKDRVPDRAAYEFYAGRDATGAPQWSSDIGQRKPAFHDPNGVQRTGMSYNPALHRYLLTSAHQTGSGTTHTPALGVFEAPEPWGPWSSVFYSDNFSGGYAFHHTFVPKWMSADGRTLWLLYSGSNTGNSCNCVTLRKVILTLNAPSEPTLPPLPPTRTPRSSPTPSPTPTQPPAPGGSSAGLSGAYYADASFGALKLTRTDAQVNFDWGSGAPAPSLPSDQFSVRWGGQVVPRFSETYTFRVIADDGVRLWVGGQQIIDAWNGAYSGVNSTPITLQAGRAASIRLDYHEVSGTASVKLEWSSRSQRLESIPMSHLIPFSVVSSSTATPAPTQVPTSAVPKLLFGIGPEADSAMERRLTQEAPIHMLTSWYNGPNDLTWITGWKNGLIPRAYAHGDALHLIVFSEGAETQFQTTYGTACGRPYPLSERFLSDMRQLAQTFAGPASGPPLYVTLFTEFQTYACTDNAWNPDPQTNAYERALKDRYRESLAIFHQEAPNAKVSLGWGGWQTRWDDEAIGAGRSMFHYFDDVLRASDFQSFQAMQNDGNVADVRAMVQRLGAYGPVMLAHYKKDNSAQSTFDQDLRMMLTDSSLNDLTQAGLFAWSFMDARNLSASETTYQFTKDAVMRYGRGP